MFGVSPKTEFLTEGAVFGACKSARAATFRDMNSKSTTPSVLEKSLPILMK